MYNIVCWMISFFGEIFVCFVPLMGWVQKSSKIPYRHPKDFMYGKSLDINSHGARSMPLPIPDAQWLVYFTYIYTPN